MKSLNKREGSAMRDLHLEPGMAFKRTVNLAKRRKDAARCGLALLAVCVFAGVAGVQAGPHDAFGGMLGVVSQARSGAEDTTALQSEDSSENCATASS